MDIKHLTALAQKAAQAWNAIGSPSLVQHRENTVFRVALHDGSEAALRLHRPGYHSIDALRAELSWMAYLNSRGMTVPAPIALPNGEFIFQLDNVYIDLLSWLDGLPLGETGVPFKYEPEQLERIFTNIGSAMAKLHALSDEWSRPNQFVRHEWDREGLIGDKPFWGPFWEIKELSTADRTLLSAARKQADLDLRAIVNDPIDYGLIHADLVRENVLVTARHVNFIDFDDAGFGWRMFDLATTLIKNIDEPDYPIIEQALFNAYNEHRPLADNELATLPMFLALRSFTYLGWIDQRRGEIDTTLASRMDVVKNVALRLAQNYLEP